MKQNRYYEQKDLRAVEAPYDAAFDLAGRLRGMTHSSRVMLFLLTGYFALTTLFFGMAIIGLTAGIIFLTFFGSHIEVLTVEMTVLAVVAMVFMLILLLFITYISYRSARGLYRSFRFLGDMRANHDLLNRIHTTDWRNEMRHFHRRLHRTMRSIHDRVHPGHKRKRGGSAEPPSQEPEPFQSTVPPGQGLMALIGGAADHSRSLMETSRTVMTFIIIMCLLLVFVAVGAVMTAGGPAFMPGVCGISFYFVLFILMWIVGTRFQFVSERYQSIRYAMDLEPVKVPKGKDPLMRYAKFLTRQRGYEGLKDRTRWKRDGYFNARLETERGLIFIKGHKGPPTMSQLEDFRREAHSAAQERTIDRAIILFKEHPKRELTEEVYMDVIHRPIIHDDEVCSIQLVAEGQDGTYDFTPVLSFQAPPKPYWAEMMPFNNRD